MSRALHGLAGLAVVTALGAAALVVPASQAQAAKPAWHVTAHAASADGQVGKKVHITGKVSRLAAGRLVMLQEKAAPDRPWRNQRNALVHRDGTYHTYDIPTANMARLYRVVMSSTKHRARGVSPSVRVVVYQWRDLTSMPAVNPDDMYEESSVNMNGNEFPSSIEAYMYDVNEPPSQSIEYNLGHKCTKFRGFFGLSDDSETDGQATVTALADGSTWFSGVFSLGQYTSNHVTWATAPLKIHFDATSDDVSAMGLGAVGTPEVFCTQ